MAKKVVKKPETDEDYFDYFQQKRWAMTRMIVLISLVSVIGFGGIGYALDMVFDTKPALLIVAILISFPITQIAIHKIVKKKIHE